MPVRGCSTQYKSPVTGDNPCHKMLRIKTKLGCDVAFVGALYYPPVPIYQMTSLLKAVRLHLDLAGAHIIIAGDMNQLSDTRTGLSFIVTMPT